MDDKDEVSVTMTQSRNDLTFAAWTPDGRVFWSGYDDAYWWRKVEPIADAPWRRATSRTGSVWVLQPGNLFAAREVSP